MEISSKTIYFNRLIQLPKPPQSAFLFGPRMTGKTSLLEKLESQCFVNLLDPEVEIQLRANPKKFFETLNRLPPGSRVILDEVQKLPMLLNYVQIGIEKFGHQFLLSGSSARKLKSGSANLLGGRALDLRIHPLTSLEAGADFSIDWALHYGTLPKILTLLIASEEDLARKTLKSYYTIYLKEEIQAEALVRNLDAFQRFLVIAAQCNGSMIEFKNIGAECATPSSTVKEYFQILEDTLIGFFLWPWNRSERKKARPKFYFFDCGVVRAIQQTLTASPTAMELGFLFETWFINEIRRLRDYFDKEHTLALWREGEWEIDLVIQGGKRIIMAFECKTKSSIKITPSMKAFSRKFPGVPLYIVSLIDTHPRKTAEGYEILPWKTALDIYVEQ
jgi:predicted AAA+ superfamily ATPase